jgi:hypothetical protein
MKEALKDPTITGATVLDLRFPTSRSLPMRPGYSAQMRPSTLSDYVFPQGKAWSPDTAQPAEATQ